MEVMPDLEGVQVRPALRPTLSLPSDRSDKTFLPHPLVPSSQEAPTHGLTTRAEPAAAGSAEEPFNSAGAACVHASGAPARCCRGRGPPLSSAGACCSPAPRARSQIDQNKESLLGSKRRKVLMQGQHFDQPVVAVVERLTGNEDIPQVLSFLFFLPFFLVLHLPTGTPRRPVEGSMDIRQVCAGGVAVRVGVWLCARQRVCARGRVGGWVASGWVASGWVAVREMLWGPLVLFSGRGQGPGARVACALFLPEAGASGGRGGDHWRRRRSPARSPARPS